jgi:ABC-type amino acid transport substrate-binding protein
VYVVTKQTSQEKGITSLDDLKKISSTSVLGGPAELQDRAYGPPGLEKIYGAKFQQFKPYASPAVKVKDLNDNKIQVASFFTTEAAIPDNGYVKLADPQSMILPQNVVPLVRADVASDTAAVDAINANETLKNSLGQVVELADYNMGFMELKQGSVDAIAADLGVATYQIGSNDGDYIILEEPISTEQYAVGFLKGNTELRDAVNKVLLEMAEDGTMLKIAQDYVDDGLVLDIRQGRRAPVATDR